LPAIGGDMIFAIGVPSEGHDAMTEVTSAARVPRTLGTLMKGMDVRVLSMKQQSARCQIWRCVDVPASTSSAWRTPSGGARLLRCASPANNTPNTCTYM
jgi:hypothetical protein